jgi:hypothetical protein
MKAPPWWQKKQDKSDKPEGKPKEQDTLGKPDNKPKIGMKSMTKEEWKKKKTIITTNNLHRMTNNMKQVSLLSKRFEQAHQRALAIAEGHKIDVNNIDLPMFS